MRDARTIPLRFEVKMIMDAFYANLLLHSFDKFCGIKKK